MDFENKKIIILFTNLTRNVISEYTLFMKLNIQKLTKTISLKFI